MSLASCFHFVVGYYWRHFHYDQYMKPGYLGWYFPTSAKDTSDEEWIIISKHLIRLTPWLIIHMIGIQWLKQFNRNLIPFFHIGLPLLYITKILGIRSVILLLAQPILFFVITELLQSCVMVWILAVSIILSYDTYIIECLKNQNTDICELSNKITLFWMNLRCIGKSIC